MELTEVLMGCLRRWYVLVVVVPLFVLLALHLGQGARPSYSVSATLVVVPSPGLAVARDPAAGEDGPGDTNPFGSPATLALLVSRTVATDGVLPVLPVGSSATASWDGLRPSLVLLSATATEPAGAATALIAARDAARAALADLQEQQGVAPDAVFLAVAGSGPDAPGLTRPDRTRMAVVVVASGALVAVTAAVALDTALLRRRRGARRPDLTRPAERPAPPHRAPLPVPSGAPERGEPL